MKPLAEIEHAHIERDGIRIAYWDIGDGPPLLMITGLGTPAESWNILPSIFASQGYRAIVVDNRDCGHSSPCDGIDYDISDMAEDAVAVLDRVGVDRTYLLGISMGGMIAQELVLSHPERVEKLVLIATGPGQPVAVPPDAEVLSEMFGSRTGDPLTDLASFLGKLMGPAFTKHNAGLIKAMAKVRMEKGSDSASFARQWAAITRFAAWERLESLNVPTLVIHGNADPLVPFENGKRISSRIPGAELVELEGVGHFVPLEAPAETVQAINRFLPVHAASR